MAQGEREMNWYRLILGMETKSLLPCEECNARDLCLLEGGVGHNRYTLYYTQSCQNAMQVQLKRIICTSAMSLFLLLM
jgi:hypothetical protein